MDALPQREYGSSSSERETRTRFIIELEFVQALSNPDYLHYLGLEGYFDDSSFLRYIEYLQYWREPQYARYLLFTDALVFLELLRSSSFRESLKYPQFIDSLSKHQTAHWAPSQQE